MVVDEIASRQEAEALQGVGHRGPVMLGTAHGNTIDDLLNNPEISLLVGGKTEVTLSDKTAKYALHFLQHAPTLIMYGVQSVCVSLFQSVCINAFCAL